MSNNNAIGVMDSGVGGLTVVKELQKLLPQENIIYYGDTANCPYGNRSQDEIVKFAGGIIDFLQTNHVKLVAIACNTMSTVISQLQNHFEIEIIGIVKPAATYIAKLKPKKVGVVATVFTVETKEYDHLIDAFEPSISVTGQGSPHLAALIESGEFNYTKIDQEIKTEVDKLLAKSPETTSIVLGCTHYPIVEDRFQALYPNIKFINPAHEQAIFVKEYLSHHDLLNDSNELSTFSIYTSGDPQKYEIIVNKLQLTTPKEIVHKVLQ